jgi:hypothetical protein
MRACFDRHGSDKGSLKHRYDRVYEPILKPFKYEPITLLEIGVLRGASLSAWVEYFPNACVIGIDTFERVPAEHVPILKHPRVSWWKCDSTQGAPPLPELDLVIDDGNHIQAAQQATFLAFMPLLKRGGVYFIEDFLPFDGKYPQLQTRYPENTAEGHRELCKTLEPYKVTHHDLRDMTPVSYLLEIRC